MTSKGKPIPVKLPRQPSTVVVRVAREFSDYLNARAKAQGVTVAELSRGIVKSIRNRKGGWKP